MRIGKLRFAQVKCNFCLEWMNLATQTKMNINICDECLALGVEGSNLKAISSQGNFYQIYVVRQNTTMQGPDQKKNQINLSDKQQEQNKYGQDEPKAQFLQQIDEYRNTEIRDILAKWNILTSFLKQKQILPHPQIQYLRKICAEASLKIQNTHYQFQRDIRSPYSFCNGSAEHTQPLVEGSAVTHSFCQSPMPRNKQVKGKKQPSHKQNLSPEFRTRKKLELSHQKIKESIPFTSPKKVPLKQRDLNFIDIRLCKLSDLKQNNETFSWGTSSKAIDCNSSIASSGWRQELYLPLSSIRSSHSTSIFNSLSKRNNKQLAKKYEVVRSRITQYLEINYQSSSFVRLMHNLVMEAYLNTSAAGKSLQLVSYNLTHVDFRCFLEAFNWQGIQVLKLVKTKLADIHLRILVEFMQFNNLQLKVLVLTNNRLTEEAVNYLDKQDLRQLKELYLGKNKIKKDRVRREIHSLQNKYSLYL